MGIIGGALPYLEATSRLNAGQLSIIVAAVLLGSVISTLFAGLLADWMGRKATDDPERTRLRYQHSDDRVVARLRPLFSGACFRESAADWWASWFRCTWPSASRRNSAAKDGMSSSGC